MEETKQKFTFRVTLNENADRMIGIYYGKQLAKGRKIRKVEAYNELFQKLIDRESVDRSIVEEDK